MQEAIINITDAAAKELRRVWEEQLLPDTAFLRIGVRGGGCSGLQWVLNIVEEHDPSKDIVEVVNGFNVAVDKRSAMYVKNTTIDFHTDLNRQGFVFKNETIKKGCSCGSSFEPGGS